MLCSRGARVFDGVVKPGLTLWAVVVVLAVVNVVTILLLLSIRERAAGRLERVAETLRQLGASEIDHTVRVRQTMDLEMEIRILEPIDIDLNMELRDEVPIKLTVAVKQDLTVPVHVEIDQTIPIERSVFLPEQATVRVRSDLELDQKVRWLIVGGLGPDLNVEADVNLDQDFTVSFPEPIRVTGEAPIHFPLRTEVEVPLDMNVPVDQMMALQLAIDQRARVGFPEPLKIKGEVPVVLDIPVKIPLAETPIKKHLDETAEALDGMLAF